MKKRKMLAFLLPVGFLTIAGWVYLGERVFDSTDQVEDGLPGQQAGQRKRSNLDSKSAPGLKDTITSEILEASPRSRGNQTGFQKEQKTKEGEALIPRGRLATGNLVQNESQLPQLNISAAVENKLMTIVSGYFEIPEMPHHPASYFRRSIPGTINWLTARNANVVYYHNLDLDTHPLGKVFRNSGMDLRKIELQDLPGASVSYDLRRLCIKGERIGQRGNKCMYLHNRLNRHDSYVHVLSVWFSKLPFLDGIIKENPYRSVYFGWFDCGIVKRLGPIVGRYKLRRNSIGTPRSGMRYGRQVLRVGHRMGLFAGPGHRIQQLARLHKQKLMQILREDETMCYDEEIVLAELLRDSAFSRETRNLVHYFARK